MPEGNWQFYLNGADTWEAMLNDCTAAKKTIELEHFIFTPDSVGLKFFDLFIKKAGEGVKIRLLCDSAGSFRFFNSSYPEAMRHHNIDVRFYNPLSPWRINNFTSWIFRDHRKILIIDSETAYTGGVGIEARMKDWRDTNVRVTGPEVREISRAFEQMWLAVTAKRRFHFKRVKNSNTNFLINSPRFRQRIFYHTFIKTVRRAKNYVYLTTPYFVPNQHLLFILRRLAKRGVDVRLLLPERSDHDMVDAAAASYFDLLLRRGVRIFKYQGGLLHTKTAVIDDGWASIGSSNLDNLSFVFNHEANLITTATSFVSQLKNHFLNDLLTSSEIKLEQWRRRPWHQKFFEYLTWPFHGIL